MHSKGTSGWYVIYQTLSLFLSRRGWRARLVLLHVYILIALHQQYKGIFASIITLGACTRGKVIGFVVVLVVVVVVSIKMAKSQKINRRLTECSMPPNSRKSQKTMFCLL